MSLSRIVLPALACAALWPVAAGAEMPLSPLNVVSAATTPTESSAPEEVDPAARRAEVAPRLAAAQRALESSQGSGAESPLPPEQLVREVELLKQLDLLLAQQGTAAERHRELVTTKADVEAKLSTLRSGGPSEPRPYSFMLLDQLRDELSAEQAREGIASTALAAATDAVKEAKTQREDRERARRKAKEALQARPDDPTAGPLKGALSLAELESRVAAEVVRLREEELTNEVLAGEATSLRRNYLDEKIAWIAKDVRFSERDLSDQQLDLDRQEADLKQSLETAQFQAEYLDRQWFEARQRLDAASDRSPALEEEVEARSLARRTRQQRTAVLNARLQRLAVMRTIWDRRYQVGTGRLERAALLEMESRTRESHAQLEREKRLQAVRWDELRKELVTVENKLQAAKDQPVELVRWIEMQRSHLEQLGRSYETNSGSIEAARRLHEKLLAEIADQVHAHSLADLWHGIWERVDTFWHYEITTVDDRPITVSKVISGLILLIFGFVTSRRMSRALGRRLLPRVGMNVSAASALQSIAFYVLVATFTLLALRLVNVPLTVFTFLGGAVAIGVGFGSQNIINNFISGLILLAERPVRVGDLIQLDGLVGTVSQIGARSTRVVTATNQEIIVPNSSFLQNNVINWTLGDDKIRARVNVGVIYGSPVREVSRLLKRAAEEHELILSAPAPFVWFTDFGESALQFELHFWLSMRTLSDRLRIESDLRFRIEQLLREAGIAMAFPQRDVHLDLSGPLEVRVLPPDAARGESSSGNRASAA